MRTIDNQVFRLLLLAVTVAFAWILWPFYGAILWAIVVAVIFAPVHRRLLQAMQGRSGLAAAITVLIIIAMVLLPLAMVTTSLAQEAADLFAKIKSGEYDLGSYLQRVVDALPAWITGLFERFNITDFAAFREKLASGLMTGGQVLAPQALNIGINTFEFVIGLGIMLYLLFFLLRDGRALAERIREAIPLHGDRKARAVRQIRRRRSRHRQRQHPRRDRARHARRHSVLVSRNPCAAAMGRADGVPVTDPGRRLRPGLGSGCDLLPGHRRHLAGDRLDPLWRAVIGLVDNLLRPFLVGKDTKLPDYVVLISTLGGIQIFGLNGFVIGPLIAAMFMVSWEIFSNSRRAPGIEAADDT